MRGKIMIRNNINNNFNLMIKNNNENYLFQWKNKQQPILRNFHCYSHLNFSFKRNSNPLLFYTSKRGFSSKFENHYAIFQLPINATEKDIKKSFRELAKKYHPDVNKDTKSSEKFKDISRSYEILSNKLVRKEYDTQYSSQLQIYHNQKYSKSKPLPNSTSTPNNPFFVSKADFYNSIYNNNNFHKNHSPFKRPATAAANNNNVNNKTTANNTNKKATNNTNNKTTANNNTSNTTANNTTNKTTSNNTANKSSNQTSSSKVNTPNNTTNNNNNNNTTNSVENNRNKSKERWEEFFVNFYDSTEKKFNEKPINNNNNNNNNNNSSNKNGKEEEGVKKGPFKYKNNEDEDIANNRSSKENWKDSSSQLDITKKIIISMKEAVEGCKKVAISSFHENCEVCEGKGHFFSKCHCKLNRLESKFKRICITCGGVGYREDTCAACSGTGKTSKMSRKSITFPVPPKPTSKLVFKNRGNVNLRTGQRGDLIIDLFLKSDEIFQTDGKNIFLYNFVKKELLYYGGELSIPIPSSPQRYAIIRVPPGSIPGREIEIPGGFGLVGGKFYVVYSIIE